MDTKINVSGRAGCAQARSKLPLIAVAALEGNERVMRQLAEQGEEPWVRAWCAASLRLGVDPTRLTGLNSVSVLQPEACKTHTSA